MASRRQFLAGAGAALTLAMVPSRALGQGLPQIPQRPSARVIVDNDFAGDPDGLIALAHQLLSPKTRVPLVTTSPLNPRFAGDRAGRTAREAADDVAEMLRIGRFQQQPAVVVGAEDFAGGDSAAAQAIVAEALRDDPLPLFVTCGGPLTNVAAALRLNPAIAGRMTLLWIGGQAGADDGNEYNAMTDADAAWFVIEHSQVPLWQVPAATYRRLEVSVAEMSADFAVLSPLTRWLYERYVGLPAWINLGGALTMGDSPLVLLTAVSERAGQYRDVAVADGRTVRRYDDIDMRLMWEDTLAKFRLHAADMGHSQ